MGRGWSCAAPILMCAALSGASFAQDGGAEGSASAPMEVDLELVLAVDISRSMDDYEQKIQRAGYVAAFRDDTVISALLGGYRRRVAVTYMEWANEYTQYQLIPWTLIESPEDAHAVADKLEAADLSAYRGTSISGALLAASDLIENNAYTGQKLVIDVSGDGSNRDGPVLGPVRDAVAAKGIVINGLPLILEEDGSGFGGFSEAIDLEAYYRENVIAGAGSFALAVHDIETLAGSIRSKLILEIAGEERGRMLLAQR